MSLWLALEKILSANNNESVWNFTFAALRSKKVLLPWLCEKGGTISYKTLCYQWSPRPDVTTFPPVALIIFKRHLFCFAIFWKWGWTDGNTSENNDHYRPGLCVGRPSGSKVAAATSKPSTFIFLSSLRRFQRKTNLTAFPQKWKAWHTSNYIYFRHYIVFFYYITAVFSAQ